MKAVKNWLLRQSSSRVEVFETQGAEIFSLIITHNISRFMQILGMHELSRSYNIFTMRVRQGEQEEAHAHHNFIQETPLSKPGDKHIVDLVVWEYSL